jgi:hypothetical protein
MSNPKEKAVDLLLKYSILKDGHNHLVKQCALIAVDEVLNNIELINNIHQINYWQQVKQEIEKL